MKHKLKRNHNFGNSDCHKFCITVDGVWISQFKCDHTESSSDPHNVLWTDARQKRRSAGRCMQRSAGGYIFSSILGPYMLLYMFIGYINGFFHKNYMIEDVLLPLIVIIVDDFCLTRLSILSVSY